MSERDNSRSPWINQDIQPGMAVQCKFGDVCRPAGPLGRAYVFKYGERFTVSGYVGFLSLFDNEGRAHCVANGTFDLTGYFERFNEGGK